MTIAIDLPGEIVEKVRSEASFRGIQLEALLLEKIQAGLFPSTRGFPTIALG